MTNYRRFGRRRLLTIQASEFQATVFPVQIKHFRVTKRGMVTTQSLYRSVASLRTNGNFAGSACEIVPNSNSRKTLDAL